MEGGKAEEREEAQKELEICFGFYFHLFEFDFFHLVWRSGPGEYTEVGLDDFHVIRCIGLGGFSRVYLV